MSNKNNNDIAIKLKDLLHKTNILETDIMMVQDEENTKITTVREFITSIIKDNDVPTNYRLYSSEKIQTIINALDERLVDGIGGVEGDIDDLELLKASREELMKLKEELKNEIDLKMNTTMVEDQLKLKRNVADKIMADDLDTSSNETKIQPINLSQEVINMMIGSTPIPTNKAPVGGWVTEDIADRAIVSNKLSEKYRFVTSFVEGNINEMVKDGLYLLGPDIINLPKVNPTEKDVRILEVARIDKDYIIQTVIYTDDLKERPIFKRKANINRLHTTKFIEIHEVSSNFKIGRTMLKDDFANCGKITSGSIYTIQKEGHYFTSNTVKDLPSIGEYLVDIAKFNDRFVYTAKEMNNTTCKVYSSLLYFSAGTMPITTEWFDISNSKKSKFDGKKVCIFGDGIMFGLGSDDIPNKSIPAILSNKYGLNIDNRCVGDATIGNYEDDQLKQRSVLSQIETTPLSNTEYVIIFAGTNDWKIGKAVVGSNNKNIDDITFKGSINKCISDIANKNPKVNIYFCTPIFRNRTNYGDNKDSDSNTVNDRYLNEYVEAMVDVCKVNHIPVINLYEMGTINKYNANVYLKDGLYTNDNGNNLLASKIIGYMESNF